LDRNKPGNKRLKKAAPLLLLTEPVAHTIPEGSDLLLLRSRPDKVHLPNAIVVLPVVRSGYHTAFIAAFQTGYSCFWVKMASKKQKTLI
jgi:hypothetical protein